MATWEDGPEYAPLERPDEFSVPDVAPLSVAPPYVQPAAQAPVSRPQFGHPVDPVIPLGALEPAEEEQRDPSRPFEVVSSTATAESAWGAVHWSPPAGAPVSTPGPAWVGPSPATPWNPTAPMSLTSSAPQVPTGFPAPGTPPWFGPSPYPLTDPPGPVTARQVIRVLTPGLLIVLAVGGLIYVIAPVTLAVAWGLTSRVQVVQQPVRRTFSVAVAVLCLVGFVAALNGVLDFSDWWGQVGWWGLVMSWCLLVVSPIVAVRGLRHTDLGSRRG
jgi:hypothetical protein